MTEANAVDQYVAEQRERQHIPGLSLAVARDGEVVLARGYGLASLELNVPATPETVYQIGSITKQFTAVAVMMLAEADRINLDAGIREYQDGLPDAWGGVTVRHLLDHTSGIKSYTSLPDLMTRLSFLATTRDELLALLADEPLEFAPGERHAYNNTGYYLLGHIIERASGQSYADFLGERIFAPLGMSATRVNDMKDIIPNRACGYEWAEGEWRNADHISMTWPFSAGALVSTVLDLARWDAALGAERLLSRAGWERMWTPATLTDGTTADYGFGWGVGDYHGHRAVGHGGGIPGFITFAERFPEDGLTVIVLTNVAPSDPALIARGVAGQYVPDLLPIGLLPPTADPDPQRTEDLKGVLKAIAEGADSPRLAGGYKPRAAKMSPGEKAQLGEWIAAATGFSFVAERDVRGRGVSRAGEPVSTLCFSRMVTGDATRFWSFSLTADGKVADMAGEPSG